MQRRRFWGAGNLLLDLGSGEHRLIAQFVEFQWPIFYDLHTFIHICFISFKI